MEFLSLKRRLHSYLNALKLLVTLYTYITASSKHKNKQERYTMKTKIHTDSAPAAIGPYSQALAFQELVFTSGQLPLDPATMAFPEGGIKEQALQSLKNLKAVLEASGASIDTVLKTTCFLADMEDFVAFNEMYTEIFGTENAPARSCVQAARLPKDALVEIEAVAYINK